MWYKYQKPSQYIFYSSSLSNSAENMLILDCLVNIHEPLFWLACCFLSGAWLGQPQVTIWANVTITLLC